MKKPVLDSRTRENLAEQITDYARAYTPEWRCDGSPDDPGAALSALFGEMFYQTVDRLNSVPDKLRTEFLNMTGFRMPDPMPAEGIMQFTANESAEEPVPVPAATQVFTRDENDENIVYETQRSIEATAARITDVFYTDPAAGIIERVDFTRPRSFFTAGEEENLSCHRLAFGNSEVLSLSGPCEVEVHLRQQADFTAAETAARLAGEGRWCFYSDGEEVPFDEVSSNGSLICLRYHGTRSITANAEGRYTIFCDAPAAAGTLILDGIALRSRPLAAVSADSISNGDIPLDLTRGDYCLGRRPAPYSLCYFCFDSVFGKRGARVKLSLDIVPEVEDFSDGAVQYQFGQRIIDKRTAVTVVPDDVYVERVVWEYFNGIGWRELAVSGDKNPFSCRTQQAAQLVFDVPEDIEPAEVNAQTGWYIRARVVRVEHEMSQAPRWIVPLLKSAECTWEYDRERPVQWCRCENNGDTVEIPDAAKMEHLSFPAFSGPEEGPRSMYFCFDRSPHAMPLSILFEVAGRVRMAEKLRFEAWTGQRFEAMRYTDMTRGLLHTGQMLLYLPRALPEKTLFGATGCWLRLCRSSLRENPGGYPRIRALQLNTVGAVQRETAPEIVLSVSRFEAGKRVELPYTPVLDAEVWVDEANSLAVADAESLAKLLPQRVCLEYEDRVLTHCRVRWEQTTDLSMAGPDERCCCLDPYEGTITFGDGIHGRVLPAGDENIHISYRFGGGTAGNRPVGTVTELIGALPGIERVLNITAMGGGTDRFSVHQADTVGSRYLRNRDRAASPKDFEELVLKNFPQAAHVKCFSGRDEDGRFAPGHVTVVVEGRDADDLHVTDDLCRRIYDDLSHRCDCVLAAEGRLHVVGSTVITVSSRVSVETDDPDRGAATQQAVKNRLEELIDRHWRQRDIGDQVRIRRVWQTVKDTENVRLVRSILLEGAYEQGGVQRIVPLEDDDAFPYATVRSGEHLIQID